MTSLLQKINELDLRVDNISTSGGDGITQTQLDTKQDKLDTSSIISINSVSTLGNITAGGTITTPNYTFSTKKTCFRIARSNFTLPVGNNSLLVNGTVTFQTNVTLSSGIFIATIAGVYCVTCKLRLPDNNTQAPEINWYKRDIFGNQATYDAVEMWMPAGISRRRAGMSQCLISLVVSEGILPRNDLETMAGCTATFEGFLVQ